MGEIILKGYLCERCEHKWPPRNNSGKKPFVCPKCKSPYWNVPRRETAADPKKTEHGLFPKEIRRGKKEIWRE